MAGKARIRLAWKRLVQEGTLTEAQVKRAKRLGLSPHRLANEHGVGAGEYVDEAHVARFGEPVSLAERGVDAEIERRSYATRPLDVVAHLANLGAELARLATLDRVDRDVLDAVAAELSQLAGEVSAGEGVGPALYRRIDVSGRPWWHAPPDPWDDEPPPEDEAPDEVAGCTIVDPAGTPFEDELPF